VTGPGVAGPVFPAVARDEASAEFFAAAARGELLMQRCPASGDVLGPQARTCPSCGSADLDPVVVSGRGTLVSWAVVHQAPVPSLAAPVPYLTAVVELTEGPWLLVRLVGTGYGGDGGDGPEDGDGPDGGDGPELRVGLPLVACFLPSGAPGDEPAREILPAFMPLAQATP
jgi:uncharacterized OB-fold protein